MAEKITLTISPAVAAFVRPQIPRETRLAGCSAAATLAVADRMMLLFCLTKDPDATIRSTALALFEELPEDIIREYIDSAQSHPLVANALQTRCRNYPGTIPNPEAPEVEEVRELDTAAEQAGQYGDNVDDEEGIEEEPVNEDDEEFLSKYKMAQLMGIGEKIKMALTGDKEWRSLLVKDANKLVSGSVIKNPRITEGEILTLIKAGIQNDEILRLICSNKEWIKNYKIRKALIECNRTPVQNSTRYLGTMNEKDLAYFAKSKNIASVVSAMARRLLLNKKK